MLVGFHVKAKRYLISIRPEYSNNLSDASYKTLQYQGGKMNMDEIETFKNNKYFQDAIRIRYIDDYAKKTKEELGDAIPDIDYYKYMIMTVLLNL